MGVYHLMGLGRSVGTVTGPVSYLTHQYLHNQAFFSRSGEAKQRAEGKKVGDMQAIILFTTAEVLAGNPPFLAYAYIDNPEGKVSKGFPEKEAQPMKPVLKSLLSEIWRPMVAEHAVESGSKTEISGLRHQLYWVEIDRRDVRVTFERIASVVNALQTGKEGKEIWMNLTGGNNITNFALQLTANLTGEVSRLYYIQAQDPVAERCIRYTASEGYWVEIPVMPLGLDQVSYAILTTLSDLRETVTVNDLYGLMHNESFLYTISKEQLESTYLKHLWKQGFITEISRHAYALGPQWDVLHPYVQILERIKKEQISLKELSKKVDWLTEDVIVFE